MSYIYIYIHTYIYIYLYIYMYCICSNWHRTFPWREWDRERAIFCTTFQKSLLLNVPPLFSPSIKFSLAHFFFMLPLFLHDRRRHWKKGTSHGEILQKSVIVFLTTLTIFHYYIYPKLCPLVPPFLSFMSPVWFCFVPLQLWTVLPLPTNHCEKIRTAVP